MSYRFTTKAKIIDLTGTIVPFPGFVEYAKRMLASAREEDLDIAVDCVKIIAPFTKEFYDVIDKNKDIALSFGAMMHAALGDDQSTQSRFRCVALVRDEVDAAIIATLIALVVGGAEVMTWIDSRTGKKYYVVYSRGSIFYRGRVT